MRTVISIFLFALIVTFSSHAPAQERDTERDSLRALRASLQLTEAQLGGLHALIEARAEANRATREDINALQEELESELNNAAPDPATVGEIVIATRSTRMEFAAHEQAFREGFGALLDEGQKKRLAHIRQLELYDQAAEALRRLFH